MNKKVAFAFTAIAIMLISSVSSVAGSVSEKQADNAKTIEVPVRIYTLQGVKEIKKELPVNEAKELFSLSNETGEAVKMLVNPHATFREKLRANVIMDSFLSKMKGYGLLGNLTMHQARELITGRYLMKQRNSIEMQKMAMMASLLSQNGWQVNAMCYFNAKGAIFDMFPWKVPLAIGVVLTSMLTMLLWNVYPSALLHLILTVSFYFFVAGWFSLDTIPHTTTIGRWDIDQDYYPSGVVSVYTLGLLGKKNITGGSIDAWTIGFTGVVAPFIAIGFCPFVAMKGQ